MSGQEKTTVGTVAKGGNAENLHCAGNSPNQHTVIVDGRFGAPQNDWDQLDLVLELTQDLLPVVSDPQAVKSPLSKIAGPGKTPSIFNGRNQLVGFPEWTKYRATSADVSKWRKDDRLGICLQTRLVRALDCDVNDPDEAYDIESFINARLGIKLPCRRRSNSSKFAMLFALPGDLTKRRFKTKTEGNFIEMLANGQQIIVSGTHTSGSRYGFDGGLPDKIPELSREEFEALWGALNEKFGSEKSVTTSAGNPDRDMTKNTDGSVHDPVVDYLYEKCLVTGVTSSGDICVNCPEKHVHSSDNGPSETVWQPAGTNGYAVGHFDCKHTSCKTIISNDRDYLVAIGYFANGFEEIPVDPQLPVVLPPPNFATIKSGANTGKVKNTLENVTAALSRPDVCGYQLRFDEFRHGAMLSPPGVDEWRQLTDTDYTELRLRLARPGHGHNGFDEIGKETIRDAVEYVASESTFDSAILWIESLIWDGVPRVERTLQNYFGTTDTPYHRAISLYLWTALAGRVMEPGIKADMVPVAVGKQGARKSSTVAAIVPASDFFIEANLAKDDDDLARLMRGKLVVELAELNGLRKKEVEHVKSFLAKQYEDWTPKFREFNTRYARRCLFFGTTNENEFLSDKTGHRRWLPFDVGECDPEAMARDRDQLWAEALVLFRHNGIMWADAESLATDVHEEYVERDAWEEAVIRYLLGDGMGEPAPADSPFTAVIVLRNALSIPPSQINKGHKDRMATLLASISDKLGLVKCKPYIDGVQQRGYVRRVG